MLYFGFESRKYFKLQQNSPGHEPLKSLLRGVRFSCIFEKSGRNEATDLAVSQLRGSTIAIISAHVPGPQMWASAGPRPSSSSPKQCKSDGRVEIYNSVSARSQLMKSKRKKITGLSYSDLQDYRTVVLGFFNLNIKIGHEKREFLNANL